MDGSYALFSTHISYISAGSKGNFLYICRVRREFLIYLQGPKRISYISAGNISLSVTPETSKISMTFRNSNCFANLNPETKNCRSLASRPFGRSFKTNQITYVNCNSEATFGPNPIQGVWLCSTQLPGPCRKYQGATHGRNYL